MTKNQVANKNAIDLEDNEEDSVCEECGSTDIVVDPTRGEVICQKCGIVALNRLVDTGPEWRAFNSVE